MGKCIDAKISGNMSNRDKEHRFRYHLGRGFVTKKDTVLDIGSGSGYGTEMLAEVAKHVIGIEIDPKEIATWGPRHKKRNNEFICGNVEKMELPECDVVCAFEVLEHLYHPLEVVKKLKEKVRKFIVISVPVGGKLVWSEIDQEWQESDDRWHKVVFSGKDEVTSMFVDDTWKKFFDYQDGPRVIAVFYNIHNT